MEELARQKVTDIHDLNAILRLTDFGKLGGKIWKILYELNSSLPTESPHRDARKVHTEITQGLDLIKEI